MIDASPTSARPATPASLEPPTLWVRLYPYLLLAMAAVLISSCTA
jgi:hypothetical protein